jgi:hypothetical protein
VFHFSGNWNNGTNADTFYWNGNNASSNANRNNGTRLLLNFETIFICLASWQNTNREIKNCIGSI